MHDPQLGPPSTAAEICRHTEQYHPDVSTIRRYEEVSRGIKNIKGKKGIKGVQYIEGINGVNSNQSLGQCWLPQVKSFPQGLSEPMFLKSLFDSLQ